MDELISRINSGAIALLVAIAAWVWNRWTKRSDEQDVRLMSLERETVTREELRTVVAEASADRVAMHRENQECLEKIRATIDANEKRRSATEHAILDTVNAINLKNAAFEAVEKYKREREAREGKYDAG